VAQLVEGRSFEELHSFLLEQKILSFANSASFFIKRDFNEYPFIHEFWSAHEVQNILIFFRDSKGIDIQKAATVGLGLSVRDALSICLT